MIGRALGANRLASGREWEGGHRTYRFLTARGRLSQPPPPAFQAARAPACSPVLLLSD